MSNLELSSDQIAEKRRKLDDLDFRDFNACLRFGTASDRYAGWIGQIYKKDWGSNSRRRKLGGKVFDEITLPIECTEEYFEHFDVVELDFTFYRPLVDHLGKATPNYRVLDSYAAFAPDQARFLLKAPRSFFARKLRRTKDKKTYFEDNESFLDVDQYIDQFLRPAISILGDRLAGIIFQQEYQRQKDGPDSQQMIAEFDSFFSELNDGPQNHIELRSSHLLSPEYASWLDQMGVGFVYSHWTWLPSIKDQWLASGEKFTAANNEAVIRLLTPRKIRYADAYALCHPFDRPVPELVNSKGTNQMVDETTALAFKALQQAGVLNVIVNNRAYGNGPELAKRLGQRIMDFAGDS